MWFAVFPTLETLMAQALAAILVVGSYLWAKYSRVWKAPNGPGSPEARMVAAD
jgi:high-affinity iron transporter